MSRALGLSSTLALAPSPTQAHNLAGVLADAVAAPLLALSLPAGVLLWGLPRACRRWIGRTSHHDVIRSTWRFVTDPIAATIIHGGLVWVWHLPVLFDAAVRDEGMHTLQHLCFFGSAVLFWWAMFFGRAKHRSFGLAALALFATATHSALLGALLVVAPRVLYSAYESHASALLALEDQQLAGLVMWVPAGMVYTVAGLAVMALWLAASAARSRESGGADTWWEGSGIRRWGQLPLLATVVLLIVVAATFVGATWWKGQRMVAERAIALTGGDPERGEEAVLRYGCGSCHTVPRVRAARGLVGPPLAGIAKRVYLAGVLYNTPENMMLWVRAPRSVDPLTAMPDMGVSERDGRDIAAFLYTLN